MHSLWRRSNDRSKLLPYIVAIGSVMLALLVRQLLDPIVGDRLPFGTFFIAVMSIAWWTGVKPTLFALLLSSLVAIFFFVPPRNTMLFNSISDFLGWVVFFAIGLASAVISEAHRTARQQAEASAEAAQAALQRLEHETQQHQRTSAAFRSKDTELKDFIEHAATPMHWVDQEGQIIWANQAELDLLGYTQEEYVGHPITAFHADQEVIGDMLQRLSSNEVLKSYEARLRAKDGSIKHVLINSNVYREDGEFIHTRCFTHDITERTVAEGMQARLSAIVQFSDDAIVSKTLDSIITSWNAGARKIFGYSAEEAIGQSIRMLFPPERLPEEDEFIRKLSRGEHIEHYETVRVRKDDQRINISVTLSPIQDATGKIIAVSKIARDITDRKQHEQRLSLLLALATAFSQASTPTQVAQVVVEQGLKALGAVAGTVTLLAEQATVLEILESRGSDPGIADPSGRTPLNFPSPLQDAIRTDRIIWIESYDDYLNQYPGLAADIQQNDICSMISVPLRMNEQIIGGFSFSFPFKKPRNPDEETFFTTLAYLCGLSLERTRLYKAEQQERSLAEALRDSAIVLSSTWEASEIFDQILKHIDRIVPHDMADIMLIEDGIASVVHSYGYKEQGVVTSERDMRDFSLKIADMPHLKWVAEHQHFSIIDDTQTDSNWIQVHGLDLIRSNILVPILINNDISGFLNVNSLRPNVYRLSDGDHLQAFANQAAVAIRNARLYQRALEMAALDERHRIARELHDAVSQTLFSANIIAESLPRTWEVHPSKVLEQTQALHQLTRGAAAEMRVLLVELRPESLVSGRLADLLTQLGYALLGRKNINLSLVIQDISRQPLPPDVQITFYRIAQESLNNVIKHGHAKQVRIRLLQGEKEVTLTITDNGQGFDIEQTSGGMGLRSMQERAATIHASLDLKSTVGRGTRVKLRWTAQTVSRSP